MGKNERQAYLKTIRARYRRARKKRRPGPKAIYASSELLVALKRIWFASDQMCSKKLKAAIPLWLPFYATRYKALTPETQDKLLSISPATIDRVLKPRRVAHCGNSLAGNFAWSLTITDILTTWTENRATWNKGAEGVLAQIKNIEIDAEKSTKPEVSRLDWRKYRQKSIS